MSVLGSRALSRTVLMVGGLTCLLMAVAPVNGDLGDCVPATTCEAMGEGRGREYL